MEVEEEVVEEVVVVVVVEEEEVFRMVLISPCVSSVPTKLDRVGRRCLRISSVSMLGKLLLGTSDAMLPGV